MKTKLICLMLLMGAGSVWASPVTYNFSAPIQLLRTTVSNVTENVDSIGPYTMGQTLNASITYDVDAGGLWSEYGTYTNMMLSFWVDNGVEVVGGDVSNGHTSVSLFYDNKTDGNLGTYDQLTTRLYGQLLDIPDSPMVGDPIDGFGLNSVSFHFISLDTNVLTGTSLPEPFSLSDFDSMYGISLVYQNDTTGENARVVTAYTLPVPEPATAMMLFFGSGIGFIVHRLRRWANR